MKKRKNKTKQKTIKKIFMYILGQLLLSGLFAAYVYFGLMTATTLQ